MEENSAKGLKQERQRRRRVAQIKMALISIISIWLVVSMFICGILLYKVHVLEKDLQFLLENFTVSRQIEEDVNQTGADAGESAYLDLEGGTQADAEDYGVAKAVNQKENLAGEEDEHKVYLTFDDGPSPSTGQILDVLKEHGIKATFFVVGKDDEESKALYRRIVDEGHTLAMHSYSHQYSSLYSSVDAFERDFSEIQNYLFEVTGEECLYYRFPGGSSNQVSDVDMKEFIRYLNGRGITYFDWNVASGDATAQAYTPEKLVENVLSDVVKYKTSIVLMHDAETKASTIKALGPMIEALQGMGAEILPIDEDTTVVQHIAAASVEPQ
ncbi:MAG: polysaccharide deacetylase [Eubacterium sp.]|jgi:peptidoglycan/xylan/chitin deacetylase (PgdA/CDA1 family)|nr:polysaccharide deacetylase [Eubacterium sp.]